MDLNEATDNRLRVLEQQVLALGRALHGNIVDLDKALEGHIAEVEDRLIQVQICVTALLRRELSRTRAENGRVRLPKQE